MFIIISLGGKGTKQSIIELQENGDPIPTPTPHPHAHYILRAEDNDKVYAKHYNNQQLYRYPYLTEFLFSKTLGDRKKQYFNCISDINLGTVCKYKYIFELFDTNW